MNCTVEDLNTTLICPQEVRDTRTKFEVVIEIFSLLVIFVIGVFGNILVVVTVTSVKKLHSLSSSLIVNLSVTDLLISGVVIPVLIPARIYRKWLLSETVCSAHGFVVFLCVYTSVFTLAAIAVIRMLKIITPNQISNTNLRRDTICASSVLWLMGTLCSCPPLIGWGRYTYDTKRDNCLFDRKAAPAYSFFLAAVGIMIPIITTGTCYSVILVKFIAQHKKVTSHQGAHSSSSHEHFRLSRNLFLVWIVFVICWLPMNIMLFVDPKGLIQRPYYIAAIWFLLCNSCVNPILYCLISRSFRDGYITVLRRYCPCRKNNQVVDVGRSSTLARHNSGTQETNIDHSSSRRH